MVKVPVPRKKKRWCTTALTEILLQKCLLLQVSDADGQHVNFRGFLRRKKKETGASATDTKGKYEEVFNFRAENFRFLMKHVVFWCALSPCFVPHVNTKMSEFR